MPDSKPKPPPIRKDVDLSALDPDRAREVLAGFLRLDPNGGIVEVLGVRYGLLRPEILVNIQKQLEQTVGASTKGFLYLAGERSADMELDDSRAILQGFGGDNLSVESFKRIADVCALLGYGRFRVVAADSAPGRYRVALDNSPVAGAYGPSKRPVCHLFAGLLGGLWHRFVGREFLCEEVSCKAQGHPYCEFELHPMPHP